MSGSDNRVPHALAIDLLRVSVPSAWVLAAAAVRKFAAIPCTVGLLVLLSMASAGGQEVEVITDPQVLAAARETARKVAESDRPPKRDRVSPPFTTKELIALDDRRADLIPRLRETLQKSVYVESRLLAALLLRRWSDPAGEAAVAGFIGETNPGRKAEILQAFEVARYAVPIEDADVSGWLLSQLADQDAKVREAAIEACATLEIPGAQDRFLGMLRSSSGDEAGLLCKKLSKDGRSVEALELTRTRFLESTSQRESWWEYCAIEGFAHSSAPAVAKRATEIFAEILSTDAIGEHDPCLALRTLAEKGGTTELPALRTWLAPERGYDCRHLALEGICRIEGAKALRWLPNLLTDSGVKQAAVAEIGKLAAGTHDAKLVRMLRDSLGKDEFRPTVEQVAWSIVLISGAEARSVVEPLFDQVGPRVRMGLHWRLEGWSWQDVKKRLIDAGVLGEAASPPSAPNGEPSEVPGRQDSSSLERLLRDGGIYLDFDVETGTVPNHHDQLIQLFAASSRGLFHPEAVFEKFVEEQSDPIQGNYTVQFIHDGRLYRFHPRDREDWFDLPSVLGAMHQAIADAGRTERFVQMYTGYQDAAFVFGDPQAITKVARDLWIPLEADPDRPWRAGMAAERQVLQGTPESKEGGK